MASPKHRLKEMEIILPAPPAPIGNFAPYVLHDNLIFLSGQGPVLEDGTLATGKVGLDISTEEAYGHARRVGMVMLSVMLEAVGSLDNIDRVVKVLGMVNSTSDYTEHPKVINGCSDLFAEVFGKDKKHARSAVGMGSLPGNITVEIEAIVAIHRKS